MSTEPKISVVIPIRNEERFIEQTISYLLKQDYPSDKLEIIVVDGGSDDRTVEIVDRIAGENKQVRLLHNPNQLSSAARNVGAKVATGEIVTYVDGHTYIDNNQLIRNTALLMKEKKVKVLSRPQFLDTPENSRFQKAVSLARRSQIGHGLDSTIYEERDCYVNPASSGASYSKEVFDKVGYFDERFDASEDYEFNYRVARAGYKSFTSLKLAVYYYPRENLEGLFRQMARYGTGRMRLTRKHPETLGFGTLIPVFFLLGLLALILTAFTFPTFGTIVTMIYAIYLLTIVMVSFHIASGHGSDLLGQLLMIFPIIHAGLGYGFIAEFFRLLFGRGPDFDREPLDL